VPAGGCLLVANHSAAAIGEGLLLLRAWHRRFPDRRLHILAHRIFWYWPLRRLGLAQRIGALPAHPEIARRVLARGDALLVFPGGEVEVGRHVVDSYRVTLGERSGFARLARAAGVPIVPVVISGSHHAYLVLPGARRLAERLHLPRLAGVRALPMTAGGLALVFAVAGTLVLPILLPVAALAAAQAVLPFPTRITARVLCPVRPVPDELDEALAARVVAEMQAAMDQLLTARGPWRLTRLVRWLQQHVPPLFKAAPRAGSPTGRPTSGWPPRASTEVRAGPPAAPSRVASWSFTGSPPRSPRSAPACSTRIATAATTPSRRARTAQPWPRSSPRTPPRRDARRPPRCGRWRSTCAATASCGAG
jgi:1-acyl-sn-glycerol-3-phosphate acyltransferase